MIEHYEDTRVERSLFQQGSTTTRDREQLICPSRPSYVPTVGPTYRSEYVMMLSYIR